MVSLCCIEQGDLREEHDHFLAQGDLVRRSGAEQRNRDQSYYPKDNDHPGTD